MRAAFEKIDIDGNGIIKASELKEILLQRRINVSD